MGTRADRRYLTEHGWRRLQHGWHWKAPDDGSIYTLAEAVQRQHSLDAHPNGTIGADSEKEPTPRPPRDGPAGDFT